MQVLIKASAVGYLRTMQVA